MIKRTLAACALLAPFLTATAQDYDSAAGEALRMSAPTPHWVSLRTHNITYLIDADEGSVEGTLTLSMFSPALEPHLAEGKIYAYGSFYSRTFYGDRTDVVLIFDAAQARPVGEIEIPPKSAGIGHSGMIGLMDDCRRGTLCKRTLPDPRQGRGPLEPGWGDPTA